VIDNNAVDALEEMQLHVIDNNAVDALEEIMLEVLETEDCCTECTAVAIVHAILANKNLVGIAAIIDRYNKEN